jgi:hypothetical protein
MVLCSTVFVGSDGTYHKGREQITERVTRVDSNRVTGGQARDSSNGLAFINRPTGWVVAACLGIVILGTAYVGITVFLRAHHDARTREQMDNVELEIEALRTRQQEMERRMVEMETRLERLQR